MQADQQAALGALDTEQVNPATVDIDCMSPLEIAEVMNAEDAKVTKAVRRELPQIARAMEEITTRLRCGGRLVYMGAGSSGRLGVLDASECPPTFNTDPGMVVGWIAGGSQALTSSVEEAEDSAEAAREDIERLRVSAADVLVGIAASGRTPYVLSAVAHARQKGAFTVGLACNEASPLSELVDVMIAPVVGPEVINGSTRLKAGTAQKMVLNMLSTGAMIRLGKTFRNLMVDMRATNTKLRARTIRIVAAATGLSEAEATERVELVGGDAKTAIVSVLAGVEPQEAAQRLASEAGSVRRALGGEYRCEE